MKQELLLTNAMLVTPREVFRGTLHVKSGIIFDLEHTQRPYGQGIDLEGNYLLPGLVELHTDHLENHIAPRPGVRWPSLAAVLSHDSAVVTSGITTVFDALAIGDWKENRCRMRDLEEMTQAVANAQRKNILRADHFLHLRCEVAYPRVLEIFEKLVEEPLVKLVSLMDHTPGQRQFTSLKKMYQYYQGKYGLSEEQIMQLVVERENNQRQYAQKHRKEIVHITKELGLPLASHDDTTDEHVMQAASEGVILCEFPTTLEAALAARRFGLNILMGAPNLVLGGSHSGNASAMEFGKRGLLDILSSDYVPSSLLAGAFLLHQELDLSLPGAIASVTYTPAQIVHLHDRGALEVGKRADLVCVKWNPPLPIVTHVWKDGKQIF
jgi:alpha-D-ribose 1-methylphosphonate 5-triphosphate diphosphatase